MSEAQEPALTSNKAAMKRWGYKVICISMYEQDIEELEAAVRYLRRRIPKMSKSRLIRIALAKLDLDSVTEIP